MSTAPAWPARRPAARRGRRAPVRAGRRRRPGRHAGRDDPCPVRARHRAGPAHRHLGRRPERRVPRLPARHHSHRARTGRPLARAAPQRHPPAAPGHAAQRPGRAARPPDPPAGRYAGSPRGTCNSSGWSRRPSRCTWSPSTCWPGPRCACRTARWPTPCSPPRPSPGVLPPVRRRPSTGSRTGLRSRFLRGACRPRRLARRRRASTIWSRRGCRG